METRYTYPNGTVVNPDNDFGNQNDNGGCSGRPMKFFTFHQNNPTEIDAFQNFVENEIPNGDYILIYSPIKARYDWWSTYDPGLFTTFLNLGSDSITPSRPNQPFIFLTRNILSNYWIFNNYFFILFFKKIFKQKINLNYLMLN